MVDQEKLGPALAQLAAADPTFHYIQDGSGRAILRGMDELHLDIKLDVLKRTYKVETTSGALEVAYRLTPDCVLEPIMKVVVTTPERHIGDVIGDLNARHATIQGAGLAATRKSSALWRPSSTRSGSGVGWSG